MLTSRHHFSQPGRVIKKKMARIGRRCEDPGRRYGHRKTHLTPVSRLVIPMDTSKPLSCCAKTTLPDGIAWRVDVRANRWLGIRRRPGRASPTGLCSCRFPYSCLLFHFCPLPAIGTDQSRSSMTDRSLLFPHHYPTLVGMLGSERNILLRCTNTYTYR